MVFTNEELISIEYAISCKLDSLVKEISAYEQANLPVFKDDAIESRRAYCELLEKVRNM